MLDQTQARLSELGQRLASTSDQLAVCQKQISEKDADIAAIEKERSELSAKVDVFKKQLADFAQERARAMYNMTTTAKPTPTPATACPNCSGADGPRVKREEGDAASVDGGAGDDNKANDANLLAELRAKECAELRREIVELRDQITIAKHSALQGDLPVDKVMQSSAYRHAVTCCDGWEAEVREITALVAQKDAEIVRLRQACQESVAAAVGEGELKVKQAMKTLEARDGQVRRLKESFNQINFKYEQRRATFTASEQNSAEFRQMIAVQDKELKKLRAERESKGPFLLATKAKQHQNESAEADSETSQLKAEVAELKQKQTTWANREAEMRVLLEVYQSRAKDSRDVIEVRVAEKKLQASLDEANKEIEKLRRLVTPTDADKQQHANELEAARKEAHTAREELKLSQQSQQEMMGEFEEIATAFVDMQQQNVRLLQQLTDKDDANTQLVTESLKAKQVQQLLIDEKAALEDKSRTIEDTLKTQEIVVRELQAHRNAFKAKEALLETEIDRVTLQLFEARKKWRDVEIVRQEAELKERQFGQTLAEMTMRAQALSKQIADEQTTAKRAGEQVAILEGRIERLKSTGTDGESVLHEELQDYKSKVKCPVCNSRQRNVSLAKCGHTFCRECIQHNIAIRSRKCASCNKVFAESDVSSIYLT
eukprot:c17027_g1_i1.p1 GENE.c17027_g1_i1~~c17027_g1_i1.p1  ORF type:complete len:660 (+),score=203.19 c17027_g1_i1:762-2741(+)